MLVEMCVIDFVRFLEIEKGTLNTKPYNFQGTLVIAKLAKGTDMIVWRGTRYKLLRI